MNDSIDVFGFKYAIYIFPSADVGFIKASFWMYSFSKTGDEIVGDDHVPPVLDKLINSVAADISGTA